METSTSSQDVPASVAFLQKMMALLNDEMAPTALWWMPGSAAFGLEPDLLSTLVLDKYFQGSKFTSFLRRLHKAGFRRKTREFKQVQNGQDLSKTAIVFQHDWFQKDKPELIMHFGEKPSATSQFKSAVSKMAPRSASPPSIMLRTDSPAGSPRAVISTNGFLGLGHSSYFMQQFASNNNIAATIESPLSSGASSPARRTSGSPPNAAARLLALRLMQQNEEQQLLRQRQEELLRERVLMANIFCGNTALGSNSSHMQSLLERLVALQQHR